jgi:tetratricopeptide (TPR) repeat protein
MTWAWVFVVVFAAPAASAQSGVSEGFYKEGVKIGEVARKSGDDARLAEALSRFQKAAALEPKVFKYQLNMAYAYDWLNRLPEAQAAYESAISRGPRAKEAHGGLGDVLRRLKFNDRAEKELKAALAIDRKDFSSHMGLAAIAVDREDLPGALKLYQTALKVNPKSSEAAFKSANILWRQKEYAGAVENYRKALAIKPDYTEAQFGLGLALKEKGDKEAARVELKKACQAGIKQACGHLRKLDE